MERKMKVSQMKAMARKTLKGKYGISAGATLITVLILMGGILAWEFLLFFGILAEAATGVSGAGMVVLIVAGVLFLILVMTVYYILNAGLMRLFYNMCTDQVYGIGDLLYGFKNRWWRFAGFLWLWTLFVLILESPSIVLSVAQQLNPMAQWTWILDVLLTVVYMVVIVAMSLVFGQSLLILVEDRNKKLFQSLKESMKLMRGNKGRYFYMGLSFLGILLLTYGTLGIGMLWTIPYMMCTTVYFYLDIKEKPVLEQEDQGE